jgi:hypothetical protein
MKKCLFLVCGLFALGAGQLAAQSANHTFDKDAVFSNYKTYKWVNIENAQHLDDLTADQLMGTVDVALVKKGLTKSPSDKADLLIGYQIARGNDKQLSHFNIGGSYGTAAGANSGSAGATTTTVHSGQLVLDMYDSQRKQLVWRGVVSNAIDANAKPDKKQKHMDQAIEKLLKDYPPQKKP